MFQVFKLYLVGILLSFEIHFSPKELILNGISMKTLKKVKFTLLEYLYQSFLWYRFIFH